jgi:hypothetical protein
MKNFFKSKGEVQPVYIYVFALFIALFIFFGVRIASVFVKFAGELLSDALIISVAASIIGLLANFNWNNRGRK